jgi:hypothetical protein
MPRGRLGGATAALIGAVAEQGVVVSRYQIERWRASGDLPRPVRHGLGRGRGVAAEQPDEKTVQMALILAGGSRRGSRRPGTHVLERLAVGRQVPEGEVRRAFAVALDEVARMTGAHVVGEDAGWQARQAAAARMPVRELTPIGWQSLVAAVDGQEMPPDPPRRRARAAAAGIFHAIGGGDEATSDELIDLVSIAAGLTVEQADELRVAQRDAELRGEDPWSIAAQSMSLQRMRHIAATATLDELQRATSAVFMIAIEQVMIVLVGILDIAGQRIDLGPLNRFDADTVRALQADPMWWRTHTLRLSPKPRQRIRQLTVIALGLLNTGELSAWEAYRDRLFALTGHSHADSDGLVR